MHSSDRAMHNKVKAGRVLNQCISNQETVLYWHKRFSYRLAEIYSNRLGGDFQLFLTCLGRGNLYFVKLIISPVSIVIFG